MPYQRLQRVSAWILLLGFLGLALMYLNGAFFAAWMSGGPPNPYPIGWERRAFGDLSLSLACLVLSLGACTLVVSLRRLRRWPLALVLLGVALAIAPRVGHFLLQDACLDRGGQWSSLTLECAHK